MNSASSPHPPAATRDQQIARLRDVFDPVFCANVDRLEKTAAQTQGLTLAAAVFGDYLRQPGKRLRPLLFLCGYLAFSGRRRPSRAALDIAAALEFFHAFILIHDDIIDAADTRRHRPTLHRALADAVAHGKIETGNHLALVFGDLTFAFANQLFQEAGLPRRIRDQMFAYFLSITQTTGLGEAAELTLARQPFDQVGAEDVRRVYHDKTTRYTIEAPLVLGAWLAGASEADRMGLATLAAPLGLAFQIENDLHEIEQLVAGSPIVGDDLKNGVKSLPLVSAFQQLTPTDRVRFTSALATADRPVSIEELRLLVTASGAIPSVRNEVEALFTQARDAIEATRAPAAGRAHWILFSDLVFSLRRHSEASPPPPIAVSNLSSQ